jgi:hypothetical protein
MAGGRRVSEGEHGGRRGGEAGRVCTCQRLPTPSPQPRDGLDDRVSGLARGAEVNDTRDTAGCAPVGRGMGAAALGAGKGRKRADLRGQVAL